VSKYAISTTGSNFQFASLANCTVNQVRQTPFLGAIGELANAKAQRCNVCTPHSACHNLVRPWSEFEMQCNWQSKQEVPRCKSNHNVTRTSCLYLSIMHCTHVLIYSHSHPHHTPSCHCSVISNTRERTAGMGVGGGGDEKRHCVVSKSQVQGITHIVWGDLIPDHGISLVRTLNVYHEDCYLLKRRNFIKIVSCWDRPLSSKAITRQRVTTTGSLHTLPTMKS